MYRRQGRSFLMKANVRLCAPFLGQPIEQESILGPLCLCCVPNMICTCLLWCCCWTLSLARSIRWALAVQGPSLLVSAANHILDNRFLVLGKALSLPSEGCAARFDPIHCRIMQDICRERHLFIKTPWLKLWLKLFFKNAIFDCSIPAGHQETNRITQWTNSSPDPY